MNSSEKDLSVSMAKVNVLMLPFALATLLMPVLFGLLHGKESLLNGFDDFFSLKVFLPAFVLGIFVHEFIHGFTWALFSPAKWRDIRFGFQVKMFTPYAHCTVPLKLRHYALGALMPGLILGILPFIFGLSMNNPLFAVAGFIFTFVACGDFWILYSLRNEPREAMVKDHPTNAGCVVYYPEKSA
ncbi:MAG: DUF3267 domain-containing protein [Chitinophagales bacterium]|nr:DUF3267 domain-containing protein [Chitinophagales bacterium]